MNGEDVIKPKVAVKVQFRSRSHIVLTQTSDGKLMSAAVYCSCFSVSSVCLEINQGTVGGVSN